MSGHQLLSGVDGAAEDGRGEELEGAPGARRALDRPAVRSLVLLGAVACAATLCLVAGHGWASRLGRAAATGKAAAPLPDERRNLLSTTAAGPKSSRIATVVPSAIAADQMSRVAGLGATQLGMDAGCSNWDVVTIKTYNVSDEETCALRCVGNPECRHWNFWAARRGCDQGALKNCNLFREGCVKEASTCWDLYTRPSVKPASDESVPVFPHGLGGVACYRIPAAIRTPNGRLVAFAEARHGPNEGQACYDEFAHEISVSYSDDGGRSWSTPSFAVGSREQPVFNPYPIVLKSGKIVMVYGKAPAQGWDGHLGVGIGMVYSTDGGESWSDELDVTDQFGRAGTAQPGPGAGVAVEMSPGEERLVVVSHLGEYVEDLVTISDDEGFTWRTLSTSFPHMDEATLADLGDGEILLAMRHLNMSDVGRAVSRSMDYGETWSPITYNHEMQSAVCEGSLLSHGVAAYFSAPLLAGDPDFWRREFILVRKSEDGGRSWYGDRLVQAATSPGYSALVAASGSTLGVVFETDAGIQFSRVND